MRVDLQTLGKNVRAGSAGRRLGDDPHNEGVYRGATSLENSLLEDLRALTLAPAIDGSSWNNQMNGIYMSRNVLRKWRGWERCLRARKERRREERAKRKQRQAAGLMAGPADRAQGRARLTAARLQGPRVCIDLQLAEHMSPKELGRLAGQLRRLYGSNLRAARPFHIMLSGLTSSSPAYCECQRQNDGLQHYLLEVREEEYTEIFPPNSLVYLTPDSPHVLQSVEADKVYVLGGLVDESVRKVTYQKAREQNVSTARLPILEYMVKNPQATNNHHSTILSINQVFDILLTYRSTADWRLALQSGVPPRKGYVLPDSPGTKPRNDPAWAGGRGKASMACVMGETEGKGMVMVRRRRRRSDGQLQEGWERFAGSHRGVRDEGDGASD
uniref:tRNA methyltransferase 10 homolog B isoform X2 n=1 Tax=Myxine glutinosa TaxID=7769 RepID=UPI00358FEF17